MLENKYLQAAGKFYFMAVAVLMYYFITQVMYLGILVTMRHIFALVLFGSTFVMFLIKPNIARGAVGLKSALVYALPMFIQIVVSLFIWFVELVDVDVIMRGISSTVGFVNMLSATFAAVAFLYIFGEKGIWYNLVALLISNMLMIVTIIAQFGLGPFLSELITLIVTFAGETGDIIVQAEIHELAFCLGAYLVYMLLKPRKKVTFFILLALCSFCFIAAFKRIGMIAIVGALFFGWILKFVEKLKKEWVQPVLVFFSVTLIALLVGYIAIIKMDVFSLLQEAGIETSGRSEIYQVVDRFYEFSPGFLGNGIGFLTYQLNSGMNVGVTAVHNDFLQYYIDLGFVGYVLWLVSMTLVRVCYFGAHGKTENAIITFALTVYLIISSATDNTMMFPLLMTVLAIIMIGHGWDDEVRTKERKIFGTVSDANKDTGDDSIL